jgi:hypothetical protein
MSAISNLNIYDSCICGQIDIKCDMESILKFEPKELVENLDIIVLNDTAFNNIKNCITKSPCVDMNVTIYSSSGKYISILKKGRKTNQFGNLNYSAGNTIMLRDITLPSVKDNSLRILVLDEYSVLNEIENDDISKFVNEDIAIFRKNNDTSNLKVYISETIKEKISQSVNRKFLNIIDCKNNKLFDSIVKRFFGYEVSRPKKVNQMFLKIPGCKILSIQTNSPNVNSILRSDKIEFSSVTDQNASFVIFYEGIFEDILFEDVVIKADIRYDHADYPEYKFLTQQLNFLEKLRMYTKEFIKSSENSVEIINYLFNNFETKFTYKFMFEKKISENDEHLKLIKKLESDLFYNIRRELKSNMNSSNYTPYSMNEQPGNLMRNVSCAMPFDV